MLIYLRQIKFVIIPEIINCLVMPKEKDMKKLASAIMLFMLFATPASASVPGEDKEFQSGVESYNARNYETAVKHLTEYSDRKPDPTAYYLIGYSMYKLGKLGKADEYFNEAYLIDPEFSPEKVTLANGPLEAILPKELVAANEPVTAAEIRISQPAEVEKGPQSSASVQGALTEQKTEGEATTQGSAQGPAAALRPEGSGQQLALAPQFMESAGHPEGKKSTAVDESDAEQGAEPEAVEENGVSDPLEPWNRAMFSFNDKFYFWVAKPLAKGYSAIVPEWGRVRVKNVFQNIAMPIRFVNNILQLKIKGAGTELFRFVFNSTVGVAGMFDVAKNINLRTPEEDLGQTLGVYGIGNGFYIVWPVLGSSSLRDTVGTVGDFFLDPVSYIKPLESEIGVRSFDYTNETSLYIGDYEDMKESALDPYISFRSAYIQYRKNKIKE